MTRFIPPSNITSHGELCYHGPWPGHPEPQLGVSRLLMLFKNIVMVLQCKQR